MSNPRQLALQYLQAAPGSLWKWEEDGRVLTWTDGTTIAFREEVDAIIERLAPRGLPSFASIVLLLSACRGKIPQLSDQENLSPENASRGGLLRALNAKNYEHAAVELAKIAKLPLVLLQTAHGKAFLADAVFEGIKPGSAIAGEDILRGLSGCWSDEELNIPPPNERTVDLLAALWNVAEGLRPHTAESLTLRLKTGLDVRPKASPKIELPPDKRARRLLSELSRLSEYAGLALAARDLMAAIRLPTAIAEVDELALGGSSGLGNRGPLDRLLLSELAHDDLTLATRVALSEALFIQREPPALKPEHALVIVLDSGLRMWGIPRLIATSAALALVADHHSTGPVNLWRAEGNSLVPVDIFSKTGLDEHLAVLRTELDPRRALPALVQMLKPTDECDVVLITHRDALSDASFKTSLALSQFRRSYALLADNDGLVALHPLPWGSPRPLAQVQLDVEKLFAPRPGNVPASPLVNVHLSNDLPAIFHEQPFPLFLSMSAQMEKVVQTATGGMCITADRRLLVWEKSPHGAQQLLTDLPSGKTCWLHTDSEQRKIIVKGRTGDGQMSVIILPPKTPLPNLVRFNGPQRPLAVFVEQSMLLVVLHTRVVAVSLETGASLGETNYPPGLVWISGRYFSSGYGVKFASWGGSNVHWDEVVSGRSLDRKNIALVFDRDGIGAWVLLRNGSLLTPNGTEFLKAGFAIALASAVQNGEVLIVTEANGGNQHQINLKTKAISKLPKDANAETMERVGIVPPTRPIQCRFDAIHGEPGKPLRIRKTKKRWLEIYVSAKALRLTEATGEMKVLDEGLLSFSSFPASSSVGCTLQVATWSNGSKAWLDSRGLLHLRSHDQSIPELTLTLNQADMAAWSSDGQKCGDPFYTGMGHSVVPDHAAQILRNFCERLC